MAKVDVYQRVTDRIIDLIESGSATGDWMKPWAVAAAEGDPVNAVTHRHYRGVNVLLLWSAAVVHGWASNEWASYRQWSSRDAQVRKGEHGEQIVFFKQLVVEDEDAKDGTRKIPLLRFYTVFNADQVDGYEDADLEQNEDGRLDVCDAHVSGTMAKIKHGGGRAYYTPALDTIRLPDFKRFKDAVAYYTAAFHELTHWSGAQQRLDRKLTGDKGKAEYAFEELIAELGSAFQAARLGIEPHAREDHAEYVANWLAGLRHDKKAIVTAASRASDAADYLFDLSGVLDQEGVTDGVPA